MSERYWITGVQLGLLQANLEEKRRIKLVTEIIEKQFIGNYYTDREKKKFKKVMEYFCLTKEVK